jgi:hypothetical protein
MPITLREFVSTALTEIVGGVADARGHISNEHGLDDIIGPAVSATGGEESLVKVEPITEGQPGSVAQLVKFDVAVYADERNQTGGKIGISVAALKGSYGDETSDSESSVSRVRFSLPVQISKRSTW